MLAALALAAALAADPPAPLPEAPPPREIAQGVHLIPGGFLPGRGPDGNTIVFDAPDGLVVVDTGRHAWHSDAILAFAHARQRPIAAIVNTHWHLDHSSGNGRLKAAFPNATLFTTTAIDRVLAPGGFLERGVAESRARLTQADVPPPEREERQIYLDTMDASASLRPDVSMQRSGRYNFARRRLDVHLTNGAVTEADLWLYDRRTRVAVLGDLVTLPAPFFETACPERWRAALDEVWATPFRIAIPGHGEPMTRAEFDSWRTAYNVFIDCVNSPAEASQCATQWSVAMVSFTGGDERARRAAPQMAEYYVGFLRENGGKSPDCAAT
jgi:glyoxylase-like metal-dependent hydrolase (beta-lactamase superfamily II)